jgi:hypothetical protein
VFFCDRPYNSDSADVADAMLRRCVGVFQTYLYHNVFNVPSYVLLQEDEVHADHPTACSDSVELLEQEMDDLKAKLIAVRTFYFCSSPFVVSMLIAVCTFSFCSSLFVLCLIVHCYLYLLSVLLFEISLYLLLFIFSLCSALFVLSLSSSLFASRCLYFLPLLIAISH